MMWCATKADNTFSLGITLVWGKGVKAKDVSYGGGPCKQHRDLRVSICLGGWQFSRRYWLGQINRDNAAAHRSFGEAGCCDNSGGES